MSAVEGKSFVDYNSLIEEWKKIILFLCRFKCNSSKLASANTP